jgi:RNA polymerase sigma-70 factor (ECF subfamily)
MQEALPAFVLNTEARRQNAMNDTPGNLDPEKQATAGSDEALMLAFSKGSPDALSELFARYKQPVYGFFRRRLVDPIHAEELTQETFLAVVRAASRYQPRALFRTYLYAIGFKILRTHRRKAAFRAAFLGTSSGSSEPATKESKEAERNTIGKLERMDREVLLLREFEELSYVEIAELLNVPVNTVRSRLFRARLALRELLTAPAGSAMSRKLRESEEHP